MASKSEAIFFAPGSLLVRSWLEKKGVRVHALPVCAGSRPYVGVSAVRRQRDKASILARCTKVETPRPLGTRLPSGWCLA